MKKIISVIAACGICFLAWSQSNVFPTPSGNVSIGAGISPQAPLHILNNNNLQSILLESNSAGWGSGMVFKNTAANGRIYGIYAGAYGAFQVSDNNLGVNRLLISNTGNVGIGTDAPWSKVDVRTAGASAGDQAALNVQNPSPAGYATVSIDLGSGDNFSHSMISAQRSNLGKGSSLFFHTTDNNGTILPRMWISDAGNVGIGTLTPTARLDLRNSVDGQFTGLRIANSHNGLSNNPSALLTFSTGATFNEMAQIAGFQEVINSGSNGALQFFTRQSEVLSERMRITSSGNVGIGTSTPGPYKLAVEGTIGARKVKVTQVNPWADYVFEKDYHLPSLREVEEFIQCNKHLPDVPSARDVETNGLDLGENQSTLLKKIEELTLYMIEQNKNLEQQRVQIEAQEKRIAQLEARLVEK